MTKAEEITKLQQENEKLQRWVDSFLNIATCQYWEPQDSYTIRKIEDLRVVIEKQIKGEQ